MATKQLIVDLDERIARDLDRMAQDDDRPVPHMVAWLIRREAARRQHADGAGRTPDRFETSPAPSAPERDGDQPMLLHVSEAAALAGIGRTTAYALIASGEWPSVRFGRAVRVPRAAFHAWMAANMRGSSRT